MRCTQLTNVYVDALQREVFKAFDYFQAHPEMVEDETTEQVFSREDRKAYRQAVLKQRTAEAKRGNKGRKTQALGEEVKAHSKARSR